MKQLAYKDIEEILAINGYFSDCIFPKNYNLSLRSFRGNKVTLNNIQTDGLTIINANKTNLRISNSVKTHIIRIHECDFKEVQIRNSIIHQTLQFEKCKIEYFYMAESQLLKHWLAFDDCQISNGLDIQKVYLDQGLNINNCDKISSLRLMTYGSRYGGLSINRSEIESTVYCVSGIEIKEITLNKSTFGGNFTCDNNYIQERVSIIECKFDSSFVFTHKKKDKISKQNLSVIQELNIDKVEFKDGCDFYGNEFSNCIIGNVNIEGTTALSGNINFEGLQVTTTKLSGTLSNVNLGLTNVKFKNLNLLAFDNQSKLRLRKLIPLANSTFNIIDSDLNAAYLNNIDFKQISKTTIYNSTLRNLIYSDIKWPKDIFVSKAEHVLPKEDKFFRYQNLYRQLKQAAKLNDNKPDELRFQKTEWEFIRKTGQKDKSSKMERIVDWFILFTNRSNSYGTNWIKPICLLVATNFFFYTFTLIALSKDVSLFDLCQPWAKSELATLISEKAWLYLHFFNPTHNLKHFEPLLEPEHFTSFITNKSAMSLNVLMRLSTSYFIYQTIVAFRKFSRK